MKSGINQPTLNKIAILSGILILFSLLTASTSNLPIRNADKTENGISDDSHAYSKRIDDFNEKITANQRKVDVLHYDLYFDLYPEEKQFIASATITGIIMGEEINTIDFNFYDNFRIDRVTLNDDEVNYYHDEKILSITSDKNTIEDTFSVRIDYSGKPKKVGLSGFVFGKINGTSLAYTLSEPDYASSWFPCNDFPNDKSLMDMRIRNDSSAISVSNGNLVSITNDSEKKIYHWKTEYPISSYLIAIYSADYVHFSDSYISINRKDTMSIDYYVLPDKYEAAQVDFEEHPEMIRFFAETFGEYPFIKEKYGIAQFLWMSGAMENQTITGVAPNLIDGTNHFIDYYVHELAHHWWGNAIGPKSWKDIWLNEGFSTYCEALYFEFKFGKSALQSTMLTKKHNNFPGTLANPGANLFSRTVYDKGAWVLHMLRKYVGKITFIEILRNYYNKYKYSNASTDDFIRICEEVSGKGLGKFFDQWLIGRGIIELEFDWEIEFNNNVYSTSLHIEQKQNGYEEYHFPLEIKIEYENNENEYSEYSINTTQSIIKFESNLKPVKVILDPNNWLLMTSYNSREN